MKAVEFPEQNTIIAKDQPPYAPLPARVGKDGTVTSCWELEPKDLEPLGLSFAFANPDAPLPRIFVTQLTFGAPLQPLCVSTDLPPECFAPIAPAEAQPTTEGEVAEAAGLRPVAKRKVADIANCKGLSAPFVFAMDSDSVPGTNILHFVRVETQRFRKGKEFDDLKIRTLHPDNDPRLLNLAECFQAEHERAKTHLAQALILALEALQRARKETVMGPGLHQFTSDVIQATAQALKLHVK